MSSYILHAYPIWDTLNTLGENYSDAEVQKRLSHWLTFWLMSFAITNSPLPDMFQWIIITSLYFPFSTEKFRSVLLQYMPFVERKAGEGFEALKKMAAEKLSGMNRGEGQSVSGLKEQGILSSVSGYFMSFINSQ